MSVVIPDHVMQSARLSEPEVLQELAVALFQREKLSFGQASELARLNHAEFQRLLAARRIPLHYDIEELDQDVVALRDLGRS